MGILKNKNTRVIIFVMVTLVAVSLVVSKFYYQNVNRAVDPRIVPAREMYGQYNDLAQANDFNGVLQLLDSIEIIYHSIPHYKNAFEMGVLSNNRAAVYLTLAMHKDSILVPADSQFLLNFDKDTLVNMAMVNITNSVDIYEAWKDEYATLSETECKKKIQSDFYEGLNDYPEDEKEKFLKTRLNTFMQNQIEINRRLSVSYTNMGIAYRQQEEYDLAIAAYRKAMALWDKNLTAENNLNVLLGRPLKEPSVIQKLFPPDKEKT